VRLHALGRGIRTGDGALDAALDPGQKVAHLHEADQVREGSGERNRLPMDKNRIKGPAEQGCEEFEEFVKGRVHLL
jgi:hypothetical protein